MLRKIGTSILFLLVFLFTFQCVNDLLFTKTEVNAAKDLRMEKENTIDVLFLGTSHIYCGVNPLRIWEQTGVTGFNLSSNRQPLWTSTLLLKDALRTQKPAVIFFEVYGATDYIEGLINSDRGENATHLALDPLPLTPGKIMNILRTAEIRKKQEMIFPIIYNHKRVTDGSLSALDWAYLFDREANASKGFVQSEKVRAVPKPESYPTDSDPLHPVAEKYLLELIEICNDRNIPLVFFKTPMAATESLLRQMNGIAEFASAHDVPFIEFNRMVDEIGLDFSQDFVDDGHLNRHGAEKISDYLGQYIKTHFNMPDRRNDPAYADWASGQ